MKLIDADALVVWLETRAINYHEFGAHMKAESYERILRYIGKMPKVEVKTEKTGMWVEYNRPVDGLFDLYQPYHRCTVCGYSDYGTVEHSDRYCGNCGARMINGGEWQKKRNGEDGRMETPVP